MKERMNIGGKEFVTKGHTYIMGILNVTPDSFSDGGSYTTLDKALRHAEQMINEGADIIDIGGESTRPGYELLEEKVEIARVSPVIEAVKSRFDIPVSVDTYKSKVAQAAIGAGADLINDIWGLKYDEKLATVIGKANLPCCLMHNRSEAVYGHFISDCLSDLQETLDLAEKGGIAKDNIILDPGVGFGKTYEHNLIVMKHLDAFLKLDCPVLLGTSRKSLIGLTLNLPPAERVEGTLTTTVMGVMAGMSFVRVHDVEANRRAIRMAEAILQVQEESIWDTLG